MLGPQKQRLNDFLLAFGDEVLMTESPLEVDSRFLDHVDYIVSYGYRFIINKEIVEQFDCRAINLHCSLLPWNRGSDPNLWSFLEDTPKGVTIHYIDSGIDTGKIIAQRDVQFGPNETLRSSYEKLSLSLEELFMEKWAEISTGAVMPFIQPPGGSYHRSKDMIPFEYLLTRGWETPVAQLIGKGIKKT